jgi:transcriptional regulator with XRE-family HTH domain
MVRGRKNPLHFGLARRLRAVRRQRDLGGKPLSLAANLAATTVLRIESEATVPAVDVIVQLAAVLKVSPSYLAYGIEPSLAKRSACDITRLGQRLQSARTERGLSQNALAKSAGVARTTIGYIETGETTPSIATVELLAQALGIAVCWLAFGEGTAPATDGSSLDARATRDA